MIVGGVWLRSLINQSFYFVIIGSVIASLGRASATHAPPKVSLKWFYPKNRPLITSLLLFAAPLGYIVGYTMTTSLVGDPKKVDQATIKDQITRLIWVQNIGTTIFLVLTMIFYKENPPTPPSFSAE